MSRVHLIKAFLLSSTFLFSQASTAAPTLHKFMAYEMGYGTYRFEEKLDHKIVFPVANIAAGLAYQRFSYVLNLSGSLSDADISEEEQIGNGARRDIDLTIGYQLNKKISAFVGYKDGVSKIDLMNRLSPVGPGNGNERYQQKGLYAGINYNWAYKNAGKLAVSVAYARFDAQNTFLADEIYNSFTDDEFEFDDVTGSNEGTTTGFSYTLNWSMPIKGNLLFRTRLKINRYEQDISGLYYDDNDGSSDNYFKFSNIVESSTMLLVGITSIF